MYHFTKNLLLILVTLSAFTATGSGRNDWWKNPGGKWMPEQMPEQAETLKRLGLEIDPKELADPSSNLLKAVVSLGGCSGTFISDKGLIITNHHCVEGNLAFMSQEDLKKGQSSDFVKTGFLARSTKDERFAGPTQKIYITTKILDVSQTVRSGLEQIQDPAERARTIEKRMSELVRESESKNKNLRSEVKVYFRGLKYYLIERVQLHDVRLVYAPPQAVGYFGGDQHNWHFPRFVGDFALLRAYVAPNGEPGYHSEYNVPYTPEKHITVTRDGLLPDDLVLVAGYPGRTERLNTATEMAMQVDHYIPDMLSRLNAQIELLENLAKTDKELDVKTSTDRFRLANNYKNRKGGLEAVKKINLVDQKRQFETEFQTWVAADPTRLERYQRAIQQMEDIAYTSFDGWQTRQALTDITYAPALLNSVVRTVRKIQQAQLADEDRIPDFQKRNWTQMTESDKQLQGRYDRRVEVAVLKLMLERAQKMPIAEQPAALKIILGEDGPALDGAEIENRLNNLYSRTSLENLDTRLQIFEKGNNDSLKSTQDPLLQIAVTLAPLVDNLRSESQATIGRLSLVEPLYVEAVQEFLRTRGELLAPDANSTLRITFGLVRGYRKPSDGKWYAPFTYLDQLVEKEHKYGEKDFEVPDNVRRAYEVGYHEPFADKVYGKIPLNFLANIDITGGNSGSAILNNKGQLVGLAFDGDEETGYRDWMFDDVVRAMGVDIRYFLWTLYNVENAQNILTEIGMGDLKR